VEHTKRAASTKVSFAFLWAHVTRHTPSLNFALGFFFLDGGMHFVIAGRQLRIQTHFANCAEKKLKQVTRQRLSERQQELSPSFHDPRGCLDERSLLR
jgi:hypothetical protein